MLGDEMEGVFGVEFACPVCDDGNAEVQTRQQDIE